VIVRFTAGRARPALLVTLSLMMFPCASAFSPVLERQLPVVQLRAAEVRAAAAPIPTTAAAGSALVLARAGDTGQAIAESYGVTLSALSPSQPGELPPGAVVRVSLAGVMDTADAPGRVPPSVTGYVTLPGDSLASVAYRHGLSVTELLSANLGRQTLDDLAVGEVLTIPPQPGLMLRIKPGQTVQGLVEAYHADPARVAAANGFGLPNELKVGDYLLLPGVLATGFQRELLARRERQLEAGKQARVQRQYEKYQAYQAQVNAAKLARQATVQAQYERFLAYQKSPERQRLIARYEAQARYEAVQQAETRQARVQAGLPQVSGVRTASAVGGGLSWPLRSYRVTSRFGEEDIEFHKEFFHGGVDLAAPYGTPIYAAAAGTVTESGSGAYGNNVYTDTGDALLIYGHMSRTAVSVGQQVGRGEVLGYVGCSGICTGPHLHFEVRLAGQPVDPLGILP